jgi:hypothetical protein
MMKPIITVLITFCFFFTAFAQPKPGDYFREYSWTMPDTMRNQVFLRVGGRLDYREQVPFFPSGHYNDGKILIPFHVQLENAIRAEIIIEVVLCHDDTKGLSISLNGHEPIVAPLPELIPEPKSDYMYHTFPVVPVPLDHIRNENFFSLQVDTVHRWKWPQNLIYGVILRVYYNVSAQSVLPTVTLGSEKMHYVKELENLGLSNVCENIKRVEYLGNYKGINFQGDGIYHQWQYTYFKGKLRHHIGTSSVYPYRVDWNTSWIPDQDKHFELAARIVYENDMIYFTQPLTGLSLERDFSVELCEPYNQPKNWVTRRNAFSSNVNIQGNVEKIQDARLIWKSWSPGHMNGLYVNDYLVIAREGMRYTYNEHNVVLDNKMILLNGENIISTGMTPLWRGTMVHGMEVQWPGIMLLLRYSN